MKNEFKEEVVERIIEMAWEGRTPSEAIQYQFDLSEEEVIELMRRTFEAKQFQAMAQTGE